MIERDLVTSRVHVAECERELSAAGARESSAEILVLRERLIDLEARSNVTTHEKDAEIASLRRALDAAKRERRAYGAAPQDRARIRGHFVS